PQEKSGSTGVKKGLMFWIFWRHFAMNNDALEAPTHAPATRSGRPASLPSRPTSRPSYYLSSDIASTLSTFGREVFCVLDAELNCHYLTENWQTLSGFDAAEDIGEGFKDRIAPDHTRRIGHYLEKIDDDNCVRFQIKHADGQWRWCEMQ